MTIANVSSETITMILKAWQTKPLDAHNRVIGNECLGLPLGHSFLGHAFKGILGSIRPMWSMCSKPLNNCNQGLPTFCL